MEKIFLSYRHADSAATVGRLYDRLAGRFGSGAIFLDINAIPPGVRFQEYIRSAIKQCVVMLVAIGPTWLEIADANGSRRLEHPEDVVRFEIETALQLAVPVIPLLIDGTPPPAVERLPASLTVLPTLNALPIRNGLDFAIDAARITHTVESLLLHSPQAALDPSAANSYEIAAKPELLTIEHALKEESARLSLPLYERYLELKLHVLHTAYESLAVDFPDDGHHGRAHIERVLSYLNGLLGDEPLAGHALTPYELYLAMTAVLYHDMALLRPKEEQNAVAALLLADRSGTYLFDNHDRDIIRAVMVDHGSKATIDERCAPFSEEELIGGQVVRPRRIAALVRFADALDSDFRWARQEAASHPQTLSNIPLAWQIAERILGIRLLRPAHAVAVNLQFATEDVGHIEYTTGVPHAVVTLVAERLVELNLIRRTMAAYLPQSLRYERIIVTVKPLEHHQRWVFPREFTFTDTTQAMDFVSAFPELLVEPARVWMRAALENIRLWQLNDAEDTLERLRGIAAELPTDLRLKVLYDSACVESLRAQELADGSRAQAVRLDQAFDYLRQWIRFGLNGAWAEVGGEIPTNQIHRMGSDSDLALLLTVRREQIVAMLRAFSEEA